MVRRRSARPAAILAALIALAIGWWQQRNAAPPAPQPKPPGVTRGIPTPSAPAAQERQIGDALQKLRNVVKSDEEFGAATETLALIEKGGPYPYRKDGSVFSNREGRLPSKPRGYYREFTVPTSGEGDRGARRIIRGGQGETYYTRDHYATFTRIDG
jgi:ribonuclease T1